MKMDEFELFSGANAEDVAKARLASAVAELDGLNLRAMSEDDINATVADLQEAFGINLPQVGLESASVTSAKTATVQTVWFPHIYLPVDGGERRGFRYWILLPFDGDAEVFTFNSRYRENNLTFPGKARLEHIDGGSCLYAPLFTLKQLSAEDLKQEVGRTVGLIQAGLDGVRREIEGWRIDSHVRRAIEERRTLIENTRVNAEAVGLAWYDEDEGKPTVWQNLASLV